MRNKSLIPFATIILTFSFLAVGAIAASKYVFVVGLLTTIYIYRNEIMEFFLD